MKKADLPPLFIPQLKLVVLVAAIAAFAGLVSATNFASGASLPVLLSVILLAALLVNRGFSAYSREVSAEEYFGASSAMGSQTTLQSLGAAWIMLANVVVADMYLGQLFGSLTAWIIVTWGLAFILMSRRIVRVREVLLPEDTLHSYLDRAYGSVIMRRVAACVTVTVGLGVFCTELLVGMALLFAALPGEGAGLAAPLLITIVLLAMCIAVISGGLRAVILTDAILWPLVFIGMLSLGVFAYFAFSIDSAGRPDQFIHEYFTWYYVPKALGPYDAAAFLVGVTALQVPLLLSDYGTWQRIKATRSDEKRSLGYHTAWQAVWQGVLWGIPVIAGISILGLPSVYESQSGNLYPSSAPLIETVRYWLALDDIPGWGRLALVTVFLVGMLSVMSSTANTYLLVGMETWVRDLRPKPEKGDETVAEGFNVVTRARLACVSIALIACIPIILLIQFDVHLLGIVVVIFSVQVALAPAVVVALYAGQFAQQIRSYVVVSTILGYICAILFGIYANYFGSEWARGFGIFLTGGIALLVPACGISVGLLAKGAGLRGVDKVLSKLLCPWG